MNDKIEYYIVTLDRADGIVEEVEAPDSEVAMELINSLTENGAVTGWKLYKTIVTRIVELIDEG